VVLKNQRSKEQVSGKNKIVAQRRGEQREEKKKQTEVNTKKKKGWDE